jgi:hypothetical protein
MCCLRFLVWTCCFPLILPPGWCCLLILNIEWAKQIASSKSTSPVKKASLCRCASHSPHQQKPKDENQPKRPWTPPIEKCPCSDRYTTLPSLVAVDQGDELAILPTLYFSESSQPNNICLDEVVPTFHPPACCIHVRNCAWRC